MSGFKRQQVTRAWIKVHKEQFHFFTPHQMCGVPVEEKIGWACSENRRQ